MRSLEVAGRVLVATVFAGALIGKISSPMAFAAFVQSLRQMTVLPGVAVRPVARVSATLEGLIAVLVIIPLRWTATIGFALAIGLLSVFTVAIGRSLSRGNRAPCRCFGASSTPLGPQHVVRNLVLIAVAGTALAATLIGGPVQLGPALVAGTVGVALGLFVVMFDDLVALFQPIR